MTAVLPAEIWLQVFHEATFVDGALTVVSQPLWTMTPRAAEAVRSSRSISLRTTLCLVLVCKDWYDLAIRYLFQHLRVDVNSSHSLGTDDEGITFLGRIRTYGHHVRRIDFVVPAPDSEPNPASAAPEHSGSTGSRDAVWGSVVAWSRYCTGLKLLTINISIYAETSPYPPIQILEHFAAASGVNLQHVFVRCSEIMFDSPTSIANALSKAKALQNLHVHRVAHMPVTTITEDNGAASDEFFGLTTTSLTSYSYLHSPGAGQLLFPALTELALGWHWMESIQNDTDFIHSVAHQITTLHVLCGRWPEPTQSRVSRVIQLFENLRTLSLTLPAGFMGLTGFFFPREGEMVALPSALHSVGVRIAAEDVPLTPFMFIRILGGLFANITESQKVARIFGDYDETRLVKTDEEGWEERWTWVQRFAERGVRLEGKDGNLLLPSPSWQKQVS